MEYEILQTAKGTTLSSDYLAVIPYPAQAYIRICGKPLAEVAAVFSDPAETCQLWHGETYLAQYTRLISIVPEGSAVKVCLGKE